MNVCHRICNCLMDTLMFELNDWWWCYVWQKSCQIFVCCFWMKAPSKAFTRQCCMVFISLCMMSSSFSGTDDPLYFQLQIEIIFVGVCCFFSSMLHVYAENWISSHIKCYQINNLTLKLFSHEGWSKDKYSIYLSGLQQAPVLHELFWITNEHCPDFSDSCNTVPFQFFVPKCSTTNLVTW